MTTEDNKQQTISEADLLQRKHQLESGLATASMHGVEAPAELERELVAIQSELARRLLSQ